MNIRGKSIRPFIGSKDFNISQNFYTELGFEEIRISHNMSYFYMEEFGFYLQDAYVKEWVDNTMVFFEVSDLSHTFKTIQDLELTKKYKTVKLSKIVFNDWGNEFFLHDPSGILWHFGVFKTHV